MNPCDADKVDPFFRHLLAVRLSWLDREDASKCELKSGRTSGISCWQPCSRCTMLSGQQAGQGHACQVRYVLMYCMYGIHILFSPRFFKDLAVSYNAPLDERSLLEKPE